MIDVLAQLVRVSVDPDIFPFAFMIALVFVASVVGVRANIPLLSKLVPIAAQTMVTLGILGTFMGIFKGLVQFDVQDINQSVPPLLSGLQFAFSTSIIGIIFALIFRLIHRFHISTSSGTEIGASEIHSLLSELRSDHNRHAEVLANQLKGIHNSIVSDGDSSLFTQIQKLRLTHQDKTEQLITEFKQFKDHMIENNQKAIIEALENVIHDFNQNLTEQFGENFKHLNLAVSDLVKWQEQYRETLQDMHGHLEAAIQAVRNSQEALSYIRSDLEKIPATLKPLSQILESVNSSNAVLESLLESISDLRTKAIHAFPVIESNLRIITSDMSDLVNHSVQDVQTASDRLNTHVSQVLEKLNTNIGTQVREHERLVQDTSAKLQHQLASALNETQGIINKSMNAIDHEMQEELRKAIGLMGRHLASISEKLVSDFGNIETEFKEIARRSRAIVRRSGWGR